MILSDNFLLDDPEGYYSWPEEYYSHSWPDPEVLWVYIQAGLQAGLQAGSNNYSLVQIKRQSHLVLVKILSRFGDCSEDYMKQPLSHPQPIVS